MRTRFMLPARGSANPTLANPRPLGSPGRGEVGTLWRDELGFFSDDLRGESALGLDEMELLDMMELVVSIEPKELFKIDEVLWWWSMLSTDDGLGDIEYGWADEDVMAIPELRCLPPPPPPPPPPPLMPLERLPVRLPDRLAVRLPERIDPLLRDEPLPNRPEPERLLRWGEVRPVGLLCGR